MHKMRLTYMYFLNTDTNNILYTTTTKKPTYESCCMPHSYTLSLLLFPSPTIGGPIVPNFQPFELAIYLSQTTSIWVQFVLLVV